jgi:hypothetical protein
MFRWAEMSCFVVMTFKYVATGGVQGHLSKNLFRSEEDLSTPRGKRIMNWRYVKGGRAAEALFATALAVFSGKGPTSPGH